jgi:hypothetical protein
MPSQNAEMTSALATLGALRWLQPPPVSVKDRWVKKEKRGKRKKRRTIVSVGLFFATLPLSLLATNRQ